MYLGHRIRATPCLRQFLTPFSPASLPGALLGVLVTQSWWPGPFLPSEQSGEQPRGHCPALVAPRQGPPEGSLVWGKAIRAWGKPPEMGSVLTPNVTSRLSRSAATCWSHEAHARGGSVQPEGHGQLCCPWTRTQGRFRASHQNSENNKVPNPFGCTCSQRTGECLIGGCATSPPGEIPPGFQGQDEGISGWDGLFDLPA